MARQQESSGYSGPYSYTCVQTPTKLLIGTISLVWESGSRSERERERAIVDVYWNIALDR